jgi:hypothetical protein
MWGLNSDFPLSQRSPLTFNIRTSGALLRDYLQDMKVMVLKFYDARNMELLGTGVMNWNLYLSKGEDKNGAFLDNEFQS